MNEMEKWHCFKCRVPMEEGEVIMDYLDISNAIEGIKCPKCGVSYLLEETVVGKVAQAEEMMENK